MKYEMPSARPDGSDRNRAENPVCRSKVTACLLRRIHPAWPLGLVWLWLEVGGQILPVTTPDLVIDSPRPGAEVTESRLTVTGRATDAGHGDRGIVSVFVNGARATGDQAEGAGLAVWEATIPLKLGTNWITAIAADGSASPDGVATNAIPVFYWPGSLTIAERVVEETFWIDIDLAAELRDLTDLTLMYLLRSGPAGMDVSNDGWLTWRPSEAQGPSTNQIEVLVGYYFGNPNDIQLRTFPLRFSLVVRELNRPPAAEVLPPKILFPGSVVGFQLFPFDEDLPRQPLQFKLIAGPAGTILSPAGHLSWVPMPSQRPSTNVIQYSVSDGSAMVDGIVKVIALADSTPTSAPELSLGTPLGPGWVRLQFQGEAEAAFLIEATRDLGSGWVEELRARGRGPNLPVELNLPISPEFATRFWRLWRLPPGIPNQ